MDESGYRVQELPNCVGGDQVICVYAAEMCQKSPFVAGETYTLSDYSGTLSVLGFIRTSSLFLKREKGMKINLTDKYAFRYQPNTPVRILATDAPSPTGPVVVMNSEGFIYRNFPDGTNRNHNFDLVPLEEPIKELWVNEYPGGLKGCYTSKLEAEEYCGNVGITVPYREVRE